MTKNELIEKLKTISRGATTNTAKHYIQRLISSVVKECGNVISPADGQIILSIIHDMISEVPRHVHNGVYPEDYVAIEVKRLLSGVSIIITSSTEVCSVTARQTLHPETKNEIKKRIRKIENQLEKLKELLECL